MVNIRPFKGFLPKDPIKFIVPPYDVIDEGLKAELKKEPNSAIHVILPDGSGDEVYRNAEKEMKRLIEEGVIVQDEEEAIYLYRQENSDFGQEGLIINVSIGDYEENKIKKHEHTREAPLKDRTEHIKATRMNTGLIWTVFKRNEKILGIMKKIKENNTPIIEVEKFGYNNKVWRETDKEIILKLKEAFSSVDLYIADGHHRAASAAAYMKEMRQKNPNYTGEENWNYMMVYAASDHQIRILPYNRVIKKLNISEDEFLSKLNGDFSVEKVEKGVKPEAKHEIIMFLRSGWYRIRPKEIKADAPPDDLDTAILQKYILGPILKIEDIRKSDNILFVGGNISLEEIEDYIYSRNYAIFFLLYPISIKDIEKVADGNKEMPPKSTWFDPKLMTGLVFNPLF
ncbi:MAG: DUF1015 domain-containing protein [Promethearchaeota archaeon]